MKNIRYESEKTNPNRLLSIFEKKTMAQIIKIFVKCFTNKAGLKYCLILSFH